MSEIKLNDYPRNDLLKFYCQVSITPYFRAGLIESVQVALRIIILYYLRRDNPTP